MRLFLAIDLDDPVRGAIAAEQARIATAIGRSPLKLVAPDHLHLTLVFLGDVRGDGPAALRAAVAAPLTESPFDVVFETLGVFPARGAPRVLWIGVGEGAPELIALERRMAGRVAELGLAVERRAFHPHLTLGRWRDARPQDRAAVLDLPRAPRGPHLHVDHVTLYQSHLSSSGSTYSPLARATLESRP